MRRQAVETCAQSWVAISRRAKPPRPAYARPFAVDPSQCSKWVVGNTHPEGSAYVTFLPGSSTFLESRPRNSEIAVATKQRPPAMANPLAALPAVVLGAST